MSEWISVKDRLPDPWENVFIYPRPDYVGTIYDGMLNGVTGEWVCDFEDSFQSLEEVVRVTHWMPIPDPPEAT